MNDKQSFRGVPFDDERTLRRIARFYELKDRALAAAQNQSHPLHALCKDMLRILPQVEAEIREKQYLEARERVSSLTGGVGF